ncbi:putative E3 ubiquitin-protein ligase RHG1A [Sesamum alatum]|uniref:RING-type E3 ubiquitin transferase n=1 Tax=Sesamum alatum TaxID=300844 RepID=A0AAE2CU99_9LAMI|nr:putative E3 ubiquitin-protein ligase RHG1A [Sesamum alatum]
MQGHRSSISALPENLSFDHGSTSSDAGIDPQMPWNNMQTSAQNRLPEYRISSSETNIQYLHHVGHEGLNGEWSLGESSSSAAHSQGHPNERKREHAWSHHSGAARAVDERQYEPSNILSLDNVDVNANGNQTANRSSLLQISGHDVLPQDLNMRSESGDHEDDDYQVERPNTYISIGSSSGPMPSTGGSSDSFGVHSGCGGYVVEESEDRPGCSLDGRRMSCKRKALEVHVGQSSGAGSSNYFQHAERSQWHAVPPAQIAASNISTSTRTESDLVVNNGLEQNNPRLRLGVGGAVSANPFSLTATAAEGSRTNFRLRINGSHQQDHISSNPYPMEADAGNADVSSSRHSSRLVLRNRLFDLHPAPVVENGSLRAQSFLSHVPSVRRNPQSRWSGASSSRTNISSASAMTGERDPMLYEESASRNIPRSISENPVFVPASEMGSSSQQPRNWNLAGGSNSVAGNVASTSRQGSSSGVNSSAPTWSHRSCPQYPRRLSEIVRRSLLSSAGTEYGGQSSSHAIRSSSSATPQEMPLPSGSGSQGHHVPNSRSALLERHLDGAFGMPYSLRSLAAASEGRSSIMSEQIRHVLDLMRRGEGLRIEDVMILDHSIFFGMADIHDRHRDMRMDVDNMSYEELLALEERIGNVCTGLTEETIMSRLKQQKYVGKRADDQSETEPCSICREEYNDGEDVGMLDCGHDFHRDCIKQWLMHKNLCPICKTTGLTT